MAVKDMTVLLSEGVSGSKFDCCGTYVTYLLVSTSTYFTGGARCNQSVAQPPASNIPENTSSK